MPYRDDEQALRLKKQQLEQDRARIEEHKNALLQLAQDEARIVRELADVEERLEKSSKRLPILENIRIASPCSADWDAMIGDDKSRFCGSCAKNVYNLSAMTADEAEALVREKEGNLCVRFYRRADGTIMTSDCPVGLRKKRVRTAVAATAVGAALAGAGMSMMTTMGGVRPPEARMGGVEGFLAEVEEDKSEEVHAIMGAMPSPEALLEMLPEERAANKPAVQQKPAPAKPQPKKATVQPAK